MNVTHDPLTNERHAELVVELLTKNPRAYRVLFLPNAYLFADCEICPTREGKYPHAGCGLSMMIRMTELRNAFMRVRDWDTAMRIIRELLDLDKEASSISTGITINGRDIMGESI